MAAERVDNRAKLEYIQREDAAIRKEKEEEAKLQAQEAARRQAEELKVLCVHTYFMYICV